MTKTAQDRKFIAYMQQCRKRISKQLIIKLRKEDKAQTVAKQARLALHGPQLV